MIRPRKMALIAIMQGRLVPPEEGRFQSFPRKAWRDEFQRAADAGLDAIEWIYDAYGADENPIASDAGIAEFESLKARSGIRVVSICADYFMDFPLVRASPIERVALIERMSWLIERAHRVSVERIVLPFVDASRLTDEADKRLATDILVSLLPAAKRANVELHLETDLSPLGFSRFLEGIEDSAIKVNYDAGNSACLGYDPVEEFAAYGKRIGSVHIKDRKLGGSTVPLGSGDANLPAVFDGLRKLGYEGDYVLQAARGEPGDEVALAFRNRQFVASRIRTGATSEPSVL